MSRNHLALVSSAQPATEEAWKSELEDLLAKAAKIAAAHDLDTDRFLHAAWSACLDAQPELRDELEDKELRAQLRKLRKQGLVGTA
jgi:hypothetical protein